MRFLPFISLLVWVDYAQSILPEFNDQLLHDIHWHDPSAALGEGHELKEKIYLTTKENERYQCLLPDLVASADKREYDASDGASPEVLLSEVLQGETKKCSYRLEPFWTYELCHGSKVTQYHEEKDSEDGVKRTEFILGQMSKKDVKNILSAPPKEGKRAVEFRKLDNKETPYYSVVMDGGTECELNQRPRKTTVLYVCHPTSSNEIMSVKEVTTCEYEIIVLTPTLCANPAYIVKESPTQGIHCHALEGSPRYPQSLEDHEKEEIKRKFIINIVPEAPEKKTPSKVGKEKTVTKPSNDVTINSKFLKGEYCLIGGSGWWQYEFCHGRHVLQFHEEHGRPKTIIKLGFWNKDKHLKHISNKKLKPKGKKHVLHFYSGGDTCDLTGKPREAIVKLICKEGVGQQLSIYMTEDEVCKYTVGVESPILCPLIAKSDANGLFEEADT